MTAIRSASGFTLIETLVSMAMAIVVFGATLSVLDIFQRNSQVDNVRNEAQDSSRTAIDALARELRNGAAPSSLTPGALEKAGRYSIVFQTIEPTTNPFPSGDLNKTNAIRVRYCLDRSQPSNEILWKQTAKWQTAQAPALPTVTTQCPDPNATDYQTTVQVAQHIVNTNGGRATAPLFTYIPAGSTNVGQITAVEPNIYLDVNPGHPPGETQLTSSIDLRNENRPPLASFTATEVGNRIVDLNASQSTDPDGLALTYKWWDNSAQLPSISAETQVGPLGPGSTQTFELEVTTPSGLTATETVALTIP
jgi:type II secretory pathway component PulJ